MTPKERAAMQQALDFIDYFVFNGDNAAKAKSISTALREALSEQAEGVIVKTCPDGYGTITTEQAEQEPVVKIHKYNEFQTLGSLNLPIGTKLYAAPVRAKDLTDDEIADIRMSIVAYEPVEWGRVFARAVIAADRSKNGIV